MRTWGELTGHGIVHRDLKPGNIMLTKAGSKPWPLEKVAVPTYRESLAGASLTLQLDTPYGPLLRIETGGFQNAFDCGVTRMHLRNHVPDAPLLSGIQQGPQQIRGDAFIAPRWFNVQFDDIHRFPAKLRTPLKSAVGIRANSRFVCGNEDDPRVAVLQHALEHFMRVFGRSLRMHLQQEVPRKLP